MEARRRRDSLGPVSFASALGRAPDDPLHQGSTGRNCDASFATSLSEPEANSIFVSGRCGFSAPHLDSAAVSLPQDLPLHPRAGKEEHFRPLTSTNTNYRRRGLD